MALLLRRLRLLFQEAPPRAAGGRPDSLVLGARARQGDAGSLTKHEPSLTKTDWRKKLTPEQFYVTREKGTEPVCCIDKIREGRTPIGPDSLS